MYPWQINLKISYSSLSMESILIGKIEYPLQRAVCFTIVIQIKMTSIVINVYEIQFENYKFFIDSRCFFDVFDAIK